MEPLITTELVALDADLGRTSESVIRALAERLGRAGRATDVDGLVGDVLEREGKAATGLPDGIAIPHCRSPHVTTGSLVFARLDPKADFGAADGGSDLVFLIAAPEGGGQDHMKLLTALARALVRPEFKRSLREATSDQEVVDLVADVVAPAGATSERSGTEPAAAASTGATATAGASGSTAGGDAAPASGGGTATATRWPSSTRLLAITACPTGIAHTYMAADSLEAAAERAGVEILIETQGSSGSTPLTAAQIEPAAAVIFAADVGVKDRYRFAGKPVVSSGVKRAINEPDAMIEDALRAAENPSAPRVEGDPDSVGDEAPGELGLGTRLRQWLMTGVSYMIPFVAAGGLLIALGFLVAGYDITETAGEVVTGNSLFDLPEGGLPQYLGAVFFQLGALGFNFLVPALAGYIAYAIADRPGIAPGFIMGAVANFIGGGFLGGLVGGLLAGFVALWISRFKVPQWARGLMPVVIIPLGATLVAGAILIIVLGEPLSAISTGLEDWLNGLSGTSSLILGAVIGLMMAFDMGGPVNKAAYTFGAAGLAGAGAAGAGGDNAPLIIMAAVMAAGMVPPLALALATVVRPGAFTPVERENGKAAWLLGASFITEGAIPFAAADPIRVIPSIMLASAVAGAIVTTTGTTLRAPHGGIFVLFAINGVLTFIIALLAGTVVGALAVLFAKQIGRTQATA